MKWFILFFIFLLVPTINASGFDFYIEEFDQDYGLVTTNNTVWDLSLFRLLESDLSAGFISVDTPSCGGLSYCPGGRSYLGEQTMQDQCNEGNIWQEIRSINALGFDLTFGSKIEIWEYEDSIDSGSYKIGICDDTTGCVESGWFTMHDTAENFMRRFDIPSDINNAIGGGSNGFSELDRIYIRISPFKGGCSGEKTPSWKFWNVTLTGNDRIPAQINIWDGTNSQWLEGAFVNVSKNGVTQITDTTDSNGEVFDNIYLENDTYLVEITKDGYTPVSYSKDFQPCEILTYETDTYDEYADNCGLEDRPLYEIPTDSIIYTFEVVDINNNPIENTFITVKQTQFPFSFVFGNTSSEGLLSFDLGILSTFDYSINKGAYTENFGSFSTNESNTTKKYILLINGCSLPVNITPSEWDINVFDFSQEHTEKFCFELENTDFLESFEWKLNDRSFASNYPCIDITFTEIGDKRVSVKAVQSDCIESWGWDIYLSNIEVPSTIKNYTTDRQYTKEQWLNEILIYTPIMFIGVIIFSGYSLIKRIGKKRKE